MMEAVPRLPMLSFDLKISPEPTSFGPKLKQYIRDFYHEDPEMYSNEIHALEGLRASAVCVVKDVTGCSKLKEYYCQLHFLQSRFPMNKDGAAAVPFTWRDTYASMVCTLADIQFEMVAILYNIGALHSQLGGGDSRVTADGMKMSCTHYQCAAWAFQHLKDTYPQPAGIDLAPDVMQFMYHLSLAQAQECILEKSMMDNRKATIIARVAVQIVDYYNLALNTLEQGGSDDCSISETVGSKIYKNWKRYVKFKIAYHTCISLLYQGQQAEEQQKMGERVAYYQAASEKLEEAAKLSKGMENIEMVNETLAFTRDVVEGKKKAAKNENEFIYHEEVPDRDLLPDIKGASLVKGIPFSVNDPEVAGPDIFARLVPMKAHEASSLYSEEKAKLLRKVGEQIDQKNEELVSFMTSLQLEHLHLHSEPDTLPQELVDCCAAFSAKPNAIQNLIDSMSKLADTYQDVEAMLQEIKDYLELEETKEKEYQEIMGKRPPSIVATDLTREANKYQEAHGKASESNQTLHKAMTLHVSNLRILSLPLPELQKQIPSVTSLNLPEDDGVIKEMKHLVDKVEEMKRQRAMLASQLRESTCQDDITRQLVTRTSEPLDNIFNQEMQKHQRYVSLIEQNLSAQENILKALTDAYARYGSTRKATNEIVRKRESTINALIASYNAYEDLLAKSSKGLEFYRKLETNVSKLLQRVKSTCKVQEEEREQILAKNNKRLPDKIRGTELLPTDLDAPSSGGPKLKDYLQSMKRGAAAVGGYGASIDRPPGSYYPPMSPSYNQTQLPSSQPALYDQTVPSTTAAQWIPAVRPAPVGSEGTGEQSSSLCSSSSSKQNTEDNKALISNYSKDSFGYAPVSTSGYVPYPVVSSSQFPPSSATYSGTSYDVGYNAASQQSGHPYSYSQQQQQQQHHFSENYSPNPNYSYGVQAEGLSNHGRYSDPSSAQSAFPQEKTYQPPAAGQSSQIPNQYVSPHSSYTQQRGQSGYQHPAYQQPAYPVSLQSAAGAAAAVAAAYGGSSTTSSSFAASSQPGHSSSAFPYSVPTQQSYSAITNQPNPYAITSQATPVSTQSNAYPYTGQNGYGYSSANTGYSATQNSWQPVPSTSSAGSVAGADSVQYYGGEFHAKPTGSSTSVSSGSSAEVSLGTQQPPYSSTQQGYPVASSTYVSQPHPTPVSMPTSSVLQSSEYQYMQGSIASCYTNAGKYATSQTCSSQTSVEGQTFAAQYNANQGMQQYQAQGYGQNYYYTVPYGYTYSDGNVGSPSPSPQHASHQQQLQQYQQQQQQQHQQQQPYPQPFQQSNGITQQQTPQSPMTYMQARNLTQQSTTTTNVHGSSSRSSTSLNNSINNASTSNVDLLAGLDFSINHDPLTPQQTSVASVKKEEHPVKAAVQSPVKQKSTPDAGVSPSIQSSERSAPSSQVPEQASKSTSSDVKPKLGEAQLNGTTDHIPLKSKDFQSEIVTKLEAPDVTESQKENKQLQKLFGKDPYTDPEALNQFVQEVEKYEKFVAGLTTKTLNGPTPLDMKWKELLDLQEKDAHRHNISVARCYPMKNRFPDILPYDHSRIELPSTKDDYINASFMKELTSLTPPFIMTQAPLPSTYADFWTMVYEQQVEVVVCLLSDTELSGQIYWPVEKGQELTMGKMKLTLQSSNVRPHWVERILSLSIADTRFTRVVIHLQFTAWPGSSFPASPGPFLSFVSEALNFYRQQRVPSHPVVVHCLSGVGRTGLFCLVAAAILDIQASRGILDLVTATANMSAHRKGSLRDREHLKFAYQAVLYYAQDLLMKIATSSQPCEEVDPAQTKDCNSSCSSSGRSSPYLHSSPLLLVDPARFSLNPSGLPSKPRKRYTRDSFTVNSSEPKLAVPSDGSNDPLSQLDPLWPLKRL